MQVWNDTSSQAWKPANKTWGAPATLPNPPKLVQRHPGTGRRPPLKAASRLCFHREFVPGNIKKSFPSVSISGFQISALPSLPSSGLLAVWSALFLFTLTSLFITRQDFFFFFLKHTQAPACFFLKLYRDLLASFAAGHPVFRQSSCLVKNNHFWMSLYGSCF